MENFDDNFRESCIHLTIDVFISNEELFLELFRFKRNSINKKRKQYGNAEFSVINISSRCNILLQNF